MKVYLDANILFSAAHTDGAIRMLLRLLRLLRQHGHECWADAFVAEEARRNLAAKAPAGLAVLGTLLEHVRIAPTGRAETADQDLMKLPEKDRPVLDAAICSGCEALVTGDRTHFGRFYGRTLGGVTIHSPSSLALALKL